MCWKNFPQLLGPLSEGAVSEADWGSVFRVMLLPAALPPTSLRSATSLKEGGKTSGIILPG